MHPGTTCETMEKALQGNICRCTGYRPIFDVCKSFASDADLEDLGLNAYWAEKSHAKQENLPLYDPKYGSNISRVSGGATSESRTSKWES